MTTDERLKLAQQAEKKKFKEINASRAQEARSLPAPEATESYLLSADKPLQPRLFNPYEVMGPDDFVIANGTRRTGKSWWCRYALHAQRGMFRCGEVFTNTPMNGYWQKHFPSWKVIAGWQPGTVLAIMEEQAKIVEIYRRFPTKINPYRVLVLEDIANDLTHERVLEDLGAYARHLCLSVYVITQHPQKLPPLVRSNADVVAIFPLHTSSALECLREDYLSTVPKERGFEALSTLCWKRKNASQALVIVPRIGNNVQERIFAVVAPDPGPFQIGCKEYWEGKSTMPTEKEMAEWRAEEEREENEEPQRQSKEDNIGEQPHIKHDRDDVK